MEVVVHGTKGGYHTFTPNTVSLIDSRPDYNEVEAIGQKAYSIYFKSAKLVLSRYLIIRDVPGDKRTGHIAFSVLIPFNKRLPGFLAKKLLDEVFDGYYNRYLKGKNNNLENIKEDWSFLSDILSKDEYNCLPGNLPVVTSGEAEAAYIYYTSDEDLTKYFENPFQDEYYKYKQVFLVQSDLKDKLENPLNALRYDPAENLTGKVDIENKKYSLREFHGEGKHGVQIEIWVNNRKCSNKDTIKEKDDIRIRYSKKYHKDINVPPGRLTDLYIRQYFEIEGNVIRVKKDIPLSPMKKELTIRVKDADGNIVEGARISCRYKERSKDSRNNQLSFSGEELKEQWTISATKGDDLITKEVILTPEKVGHEIVLNLEKRKKKSGNNGTPSGQILYTAKPGNHGRFKDGNYHTTYNPDGSDLIHLIKADNGWEFTHFEPSGKILTAQYKKELTFYKKPIFVKSLIVSFFTIFIVIAVIWLFNDNDEEAHDDISQAYKYTQGAEWNLKKLEDYKSEFCLDANDSKSQEEEGLFHKILSTGGTKESGQDYVNDSICERISDAIKLREHINLGKIDAILAMDYAYSEDQLEFKKAIEGIDSLQKDFIGSSMDKYKVSEMDLNEIAEFIQSIEELLSIDSESREDGNNLIELKDKLDKYVDKKVNAESLSEIEKLLETLQDELGLDENEEENSEKENLSVEETANNPVEEKVEVIPGKPISITPPSSDANLENEFWELIRSNDVKDQNFSSYATLLDNYSNSNSDIIDFIEQMDKNFSKFKNMNQGKIDDILKSDPPSLSILKEEFNN